MSINRLARQIAELTDRVNTVERAASSPRLTSASVHGGGIDFYDYDDNLLGRIGVQPDGSLSFAPSPDAQDVSPEPPTPAGFTVEPVDYGLVVAWGGAFAEDAIPPESLAFLEVHASTEADFTPSPETFQGVIPRAGGKLTIAPLTVEPWNVRLIAVTSSYTESDATGTITATPTASTVGPGSITETEIADNSISTPKLMANAVTAQKLEAILTLSTRIVSGDPSGDRTEMNENGIFAYHGGQVSFSLSSIGDAFFSGLIQGAEIRGSAIHVGDTSEVTRFAKLIDAPSTGRSMFAAGAGGSLLPYAQVSSTDSAAELVLRSQRGDATQPKVEGIAVSYASQLSAYSGDSSKPGVTITAYPNSVQQSLRSVQGDPDAPSALHVVDENYAQSEWRSISGSRVILRAAESGGFLYLQPPPDEVEGGDNFNGIVYADRRPSGIGEGTQPAVMVQAPQHDPMGRRGRIEVVGDGGGSLDPVVNVRTATVRLYGAMSWSGGGPPIEDPVYRLDMGSKSLEAPRMRPTKFRYLTGKPTGQPTVSYGPLNFGASVWERGTFLTPASGVVRIEITVYISMITTGGTVLTIGYSLTPSGGSIIPATRDRCLEMRFNVDGAGLGNGIQRSTLVIEDSLLPDTVYTLIPQWSGTVSEQSVDWGNSSGTGANVRIHNTNRNEIIVTPQP